MNFKTRNVGNYSSLPMKAVAHADLSIKVNDVKNGIKIPHDKLRCL